MARLVTSLLRCIVLASLVVPWVGVASSSQVNELPQVKNGIPGYHVTDSDGDTIYDVNAPYNEELYTTTAPDMPEAEDEVIEVDSDAEVDLPPRVNSYETPNTPKSTPTPYSARPQPQPVRTQPQPVRTKPQPVRTTQGYQTYVHQPQLQPQPLKEDFVGIHTNQNKNTRERTPTSTRQTTRNIKVNGEDQAPSVFRDVFGRPLYQPRRREPSPTYNNNNHNHNNDNNNNNHHNERSINTVGVGTPAPQRFGARSDRRRQANPWSQLEQLEQFSSPSLMDWRNKLFQDRNRDNNRDSNRDNNRVNVFNLMMMNNLSPFGRLSDNNFNRFPMMNQNILQNHIPSMLMRPQPQPQHCHYH